MLAAVYPSIPDSDNPFSKKDPKNVLPSDSFNNNSNNNNNNIDWKSRFMLHHAWATRKGQNVVVSPCSFPETISTALRMHPLNDNTLEQQQQQQQQQRLHMGAHHTHDHHNLQLHQHVPQDAMLHIEDISSTKSCQLQNSTYDTLSSSSNNNNNNNNPSLASSTPLSEETLICSLCTYSDLLVIPNTSGICVRTQRNRDLPLMQVLDGSLHPCAAPLSTVDCHHDLVSGLAVNTQGSIMVSSSIDTTIRVWTVNSAFHDDDDDDDDVSSRRRISTMSFAQKVLRYGCPIQFSKVLHGHIGWVNAVAIENTTIVSGGSDHTIRAWDANTGECLRIISDLYTSRDLGLGVYSVTILNSVIGSGSITEGYQLHDLSTGRVLMEMDEPLSSREHFRFESTHFQHYASRLAMTETMVVTNSKLSGLLCVWDRGSGKLKYRIRVCPPPLPPVAPSSHDRQVNNPLAVKNAPRRCSRWSTQRMVSHEPDDMVVTYSLQSQQQQQQHVTNQQDTASYGTDSPTQDTELETIHTFKLSSSESMLMCTMCDGRVSIFDFRVPSTHSPPKLVQLVQRMSSAPAVSGEHQCGYSAWIWTRTEEGQQQLTLT
ncbi:hypothetical protein BG004_004989 [Podila humilis]|nr:hypothetical protein BG004_004989 [Podila humilis]